jgi:hypothetical protein
MTRRGSSPASRPLAENSMHSWIIASVVGVLDAIIGHLLGWWGVPLAIVTTWVAIVLDGYVGRRLRAPV